MEKSKIQTRQIMSIIINVAIVIMEVIAILLSFNKNNLSLFMFYTEDSNLFAMFASALVSIATIIAIKKKSNIPKYIQIIKYMATCCLALTFVVVIFILAPMLGKNGFKIMLLENSMLYHHLICPILVIISFVFLESTPEIDHKYTYLAMAPTIIYAIVAALLNIFKVIEGPYPFLKVYNQPIYMSIVWFAVILIGAYIIAVMLRQAVKIKHKKD